MRSTFHIGETTMLQSNCIIDGMGFAMPSTVRIRVEVHVLCELGKSMPDECFTAPYATVIGPLRRYREACPCYGKLPGIPSICRNPC